MKTIGALGIGLLTAIPALGQSAQTKTFTLNGVDFSFQVSKTLDGKDFGYFVPNVRWPSSADQTTTVYCCWENYSDDFAQEHRVVQQAVTATWQQNSKIEFRGWRSCAERSSGIRIRVSEDGPHTKGLGRQLDGKPHGMVLNFTFNKWSEECKESETVRQLCIKSIAVHEFGHAIGFAHEQNRPDKPGECSRPPQGPSAGAVMLTPYDPHSVMNYCNDKYNNDGALSALDIKALQSIYGAR